MQPRTFVLTALAAGATSVLALITHAATNRFTDPPTSGAKLVAPLATGNAKVGTVVVQRGGQTLTLRAKDEAGRAWGIEERGGFPADPDRVRAMLVKLAQAELLEARTKLPDRHALLELENPGKDAKSRIVRLLDPKGGMIADLVLGKRKIEAFGSGRAGTYVRRAGEAQTWLATLDFEPSVELTAWLKPSLVEIESSKLADVAVAIPGEDVLLLKSNDGKFSFQTFPPDGRKLKEAAAAETLARAAGLVDFDDVRKAAATLPGEPAGTVTVTTTQGMVVTLALRRDGDAHWVTATATATAAGTGEAKAAADAFNARSAGWDFRLPSSKVEALLKKRGDLLEPEKAG
jgi:hypothetical protein